MSPPVAPYSDSLGSGLRGTLGSRITWLILMAVPLAVVIVATTLNPDPAGHGTHTQLGLPPCGFLVTTGLACPGCGLTTCFSHMVRLQIVDAAQANPFGVALFLVTVFSIPVSTWGLFRGLPVMDTLERLHVEKVVVLLAASSAVVWLTRLASALL